MSHRMSCRGRRPHRGGYWILRDEDRASRCLEKSRREVTAKNSRDGLMVMSVSKDDEGRWERMNDFHRCCRAQVERLWMMQLYSS